MKKLNVDIPDFFIDQILSIYKDLTRKDMTDKQLDDVILGLVRVIGVYIDSKDIEEFLIEDVINLR